MFHGGRIRGRPGHVAPAWPRNAGRRAAGPAYRKMPRWERSCWCRPARAISRHSNSKYFGMLRGAW